MRVGTAFRYDQLSSQIRRSESRSLAAENRVISGKRIEKPSDDAGGTRTLIGIGAIRKGIAGYTKNLDVAKGALVASENAYGDMGDLMQQAQTLAIQGASSTLSESERANLTGQIDELQKRLVSLGNSQGPDGRYLFSGQATDTKPFTTDAEGALVYAGNTIVPTVETGPGENARVGETGGIVSDAYAQLKSLNDSLASGDIATISDSRIAGLQRSHEALVSGRADVGRRMNAVEATRSVHSRRETELSARASEIGEVDFASAIVDYTAAQSAYQAALTVASKGFTTGLMDFIR